MHTSPTHQRLRVQGGSLGRTRTGLLCYGSNTRHPQNPKTSNPWQYVWKVLQDIYAHEPHPPKIRITRHRSLWRTCIGPIYWAVILKKGWWKDIHNTLNPKTSNPLLHVWKNIYLCTWAPPTKDQDYKEGPWEGPT
jgi:hypothetical protein